MSDTVHLRLPATSANLGPGFDAVGLAMELYLDVRATPAEHWTLAASGRDRELVGSLEGNLLVDTYRDLAPRAPALALTIRNDIPLGMGCGSSAAALAAGVLLANRFGGLGLDAAAVLDEACRREGHPDNVAAALLGGFTVSSMRAGRVTAASFGAGSGGRLPWRLLLALPAASLATEKARALLPPQYPRTDTVANIQAVALLVAAFATGRPELLAEATRDRVHQPYRGAACPLLPALQPLAGTGGIYSVTLSGAGPSVLLLADPQVPVATQIAAIHNLAGAETEVLETRIAGPYEQVGAGQLVT